MKRIRQRTSIGLVAALEDSARLPEMRVPIMENLIRKRLWETDLNKGRMV